MKKVKLLLTTLIASLALGLTGCTLFNDDDMSYSNSFNSIVTSQSDPNAIVAGGVTAKENTELNSYVFKNIGYAVDNTIVNTYKDGGANHTEYHVNHDEDYSATKSSNNYDLYVPKTAPKNDKHVVILFIHGGAWISGWKTDVNAYVHEFAKRGYITATIKYTLLKRSMDDDALSIFRNLDEIDACISSIAEVLDELEFDTTKTNLVIGGASSGSHLAMLYSYSRGEHADLPIKFVVNAVGPVNIKPSCWLSFKSETEEVLNAGLTKAAIDDQQTAGNLKQLYVAGSDQEKTGGYTWCDYQTMRIANGMCGLPYSLTTVKAATDEEEVNIVDPSNEAAISMTKAGGGEDQLSVTYWMKDTYKLPMICAYSGKDTIVGVGQYAQLEEALDLHSIEHEYFYFKNCGHANLDTDTAQYNAFLNKIDQWCKAI